MTSIDLVSSPTIFDRMLGFAHTPGVPPPARKPPAERYFACYERTILIPKQPLTYECHQGTFEQVSAATFQDKMSGTPARMVSIAAACPSWNDQLVLGRKLGAAVILGKPIGS